jgi:hypothetical protein
MGDSQASRMAAALDYPQRYRTTEEKLDRCREAAAYRDAKMRELLAYCRNESRSPNPDWSAAYRDVDDRLAAILNGEA